MATVKKGTGFDNPLCLEYAETIVSSSMRQSAYHDVVFRVYSGQVHIYGASGITMATDEAIKLFAGLLEDIKAASNG